jgi:hypothetical protein
MLGRGSAAGKVHRRRAFLSHLVLLEEALIINGIDLRPGVMGVAGGRVALFHVRLPSGW